MIKKTKTVFALILTFVFLLSASACGEVQVVPINKETASSETAAALTQPSATTAQEIQGSDLSGSLTLTSSTSMADVTTALTEAFMAVNTDVNVSVGGNGSGEGPTAVNDGTAQIGLLSDDGIVPNPGKN